MSGPRNALLVAGVAGLGVLASPSFADEGGVGFWLPGLYGSLAAVPTDPGWSVAGFYYHSSVTAGAGRSFARGGRIDTGLSGSSNLFFFGPTYTFQKPVLGAQVAVSILAAYGQTDASIDATLVGPHGHAISGMATDSRAAIGDLAPQITLKWNRGVNNFLAYATGDVPVGAYDADRLANLGTNHGAIDAGGGYTYLNPKTGIEFSGVPGFTYNLENPATKYQNGVDFHFDWGASYFVTQAVQLGAVGYVYQQISPDSGPGARLGAFESRVAGIGPQIGYSFALSERVKGYVNLKGYKEFAAQNRPAGWNLWLTVSFALVEPGR